MSERFTPFYEWAAEWDELTLPEALVLSRIKMWGNRGCYEKYSTLAKALKLGQRTVIRAVMTLRDKKLIKIEKTSNQKRILYFNFERTNLPIFDQEPMPPRHSKSAKKTPTYATQAQQPMPHRHNTIYCTKQDKEINETTNLLALLLTTQKGKPLTQKQFQERKQKLLKGLTKPKRS